MQVEHITRSHGGNEYVVHLTEEEMQDLYLAIGELDYHRPPPIWPVLLNALDLLDRDKFPTVF